VEREPDIDAIAEAPVSAPVDRRELASVFAGGFLGAIARAAPERALAAAPGAWPWATFAVNVLAAALLGFAVTWLGERHPRTMYARAFLATGLCGALSTFSAVTIELVHLYEHTGLGAACGYAAASVAAGGCALLAGIRVAAWVPAHLHAGAAERRR
jgi:fluoride exporter